MKTLLGLLHGLFVFALAVLLTFGIGLGMPTAVTFHHITDAAIVTDWLARADVYRAIVRAGFLSSLETIHEQDETLPLLYSRTLANRYVDGFPVDAAQNIIDSVIFSFYNYLSDSTDTVELNLNTDHIQSIITYIQTNGAQIITDHVQQLPICSGQPDNLNDQRECIPQNLTHAQLAERFQDYWQAEHEDLPAAPIFQPEFDNYESLEGMRTFFIVARSFTEWWLAGLLLTCLLLVYVRRDRLRGLRDLRNCWVIGTVLSIIILLIAGLLLNTIVKTIDISDSVTSSDRLFQASFQRVTMIAIRIIAVQTVLAGLLGSSLSWTALHWSQQLKQAR